MANCFIGGPYDGLRLDDYQLIEFATPVPLRTKSGFHVFVLLPALCEWDQVVAGEFNDFRGHYAYELIIAGGTEEFQDAVENGRYHRAINETSRY